MIPRVTACLLLTTDFEWASKLALSVDGTFAIRATASRAEWMRELSGALVQLLDLRHPEARLLLRETAADALSAVVALGVPDSDLFVFCQGDRLFAVEPLNICPEHLRKTLRQAFLLRQAQDELSLLRQESVGAFGPPQPDEPDLNLAPLHELWRASRHFQDIQRLLDQLVEGVSAAGRLARVGVFARLRDEENYRLWAGRRCLDRTGAITYGPHDPFVRWLERHAHLVCRNHLIHVEDLRARRLLQRVLDDAGAEIIVPLLGKRGLLGWILVGHRTTGIPFVSRNLTDLSVIGEQVATLLENAMLVEELAVQKALAESLLEAIPVGILAASEDGVVRWFNRAAEQISGVTAKAAVGRRVEEAGSRVADVVLRAIRDGSLPAPVVWTDAASGRTIQASALRIGSASSRLGAMLMLSDITRERLLRQKQDELERNAFWNDLAASMSHEVRNPLVAINTFTQLLPERYGDPEFRQQFFDIVSSEVGRLNAIITQINTFAHPPKPVFSPVSPRELAEKAWARAAALTGADERLAACDVSERLPILMVDADSLVGALAHVLVNAVEAVAGRPLPRIGINVRAVGSGGACAIVFAVSDNGPGIAPEMRAKLFSPFSTNKPRGLGLGLPLAQRAAVDHGGRIDVESNAQGTTVSLTVPLEGRAEHAEITHS